MIVNRIAEARVVYTHECPGMTHSQSLETVNRSSKQTDHDNNTSQCAKPFDFCDVKHIRVSALVVVCVRVCVRARVCVCV